MAMYNSMFSYEAGVRKGRSEQIKKDIIIIEEVAKKFNLNSFAINRLILKIKNGETY